MEDLMAFAVENAPYMWLAAGVLLLSGEMVIPGVYLLWIGLASLVTGAVAFVTPGWGFDGHGLLFAGLSVVSIYIGHTYFYGKGKTEPDQAINTLGARHIGKTYVVVEAIKNGRGHVKVGDSQWLAEGPDSAEGTKMRVVAIEGTILKVEPENS